MNGIGLDEYEGGKRKEEREGGQLGEKKGKEDRSVTTLNDGMGKVAGLGFPFVYVLSSIDVGLC
jgi:hypothetical protein